ncbi:PadR family transcriptional regulator [Salinilacihabitans rarus]|uniref:PadR family transcriptional regulator n=1 Tax=Salinilacihabitans rarus TaxID=2961596 RepID=UPI0020C8479B|nr:helix-turn-helix transcriptional regulator [Salinilacihabitans rarus]
MDDLTGFQRDLLYVIAGMDHPSGQAVKDELDTYYKTTIDHGHLYSNLDILVEKGLVEKGRQDRRTNYYELTDAGEAEIRDRRAWRTQYIELEV